MSKIKSREKVKDIKVLDKSAIASQRMKNAFIRSKERMIEQQEEREDTSPCCYAGNKLQNAANEAGQLGTYSAKLAFCQGKQMLQRQRAKEAADLRRKHVPDASPVSDTLYVPRTETPTNTSAEQGYQTLPVKSGSGATQQQRARQREQLRRMRKKADTIRGGSQRTDGQAPPLIRQRSASGTPDSRETKLVRKDVRTLKTPQHTSNAMIKTRQALEAKRQTGMPSSAQIAAQSARTAVKTSAGKVKHVARATAAELRAVAMAARTSLTALLSSGWIVVLMAVIIVLFGGVLALFGDSTESNAYTPVSAEVDAYTPLIQIYAERHGIPDFVDLIKAVMMTESGGKGNDPMQASECGYNTRYPRKPNGITDPEYSIDVGIQNLAAVLQAAGAEDPLDLERIKLALQGYNFGNGYISWALDKYGGYSEANAIEFSEMMAKRLGWSRYGSTKYVSVVLQYYPFGYKFSAEGDGEYIWPLPGYTRISSPFGYRICPYHGRELHGGVDIPAPHGTNILAAKSGTVVVSTYGSSYGNYVAISHADGSRTMYCHMSARLVSVGDPVVQGQVIGKVGSTGNSTGNHLHFEVWTNNSSSSRVNPMGYF